MLAPASDFPGYDAMWTETEDDPDLQNEPILQLDIQVCGGIAAYSLPHTCCSGPAHIQAHLLQYLTQLVQQPCFASFLPMLTDSEKEMLRTLGPSPV